MEKKINPHSVTSGGFVVLRCNECGSDMVSGFPGFYVCRNCGERLEEEVPLRKLDPIEEAEILP